MQPTIRGAAGPAHSKSPSRGWSGGERPDFLRLGLGLVIVMVVSRVHQTVPFIASLRPALVLTVGAIAYAILRPSALVRGDVLRYWWTRLILLVVLQACLSTAFGISIGNSGRFMIFAYSTVIALAGLLIISIRSTSDLLVYVLALLVGVAALAFQAIFLFSLSHDGGLSRLSSLYAFDANDVGLIFVVAIPPAVALFSVWRGWRRLMVGVLVAAIGIGIARTGSRGAFLALVVSGGIMLTVNRGVPVGKRVGLTVAILVALLVAAPSGYFEQMSTIVNPTTDYNWTSATGRKAVTERGIGYMLRFPLFGLGINNFQKAECSISDRAQEQMFGTGIRCTPPHNTWIQVGAELGFPGLIVWFVMLAYAVQKLFALSRRLPIGWQRGDFEQRFLFACASSIPISIIGFMVASSFLTFAWIDIPYLLVVFAGSTWLFTRRRLEADLASRSPEVALLASRGRASR